MNSVRTVVRLKALVVEDNLAQARYLCAILKAQGHTALHASDGLTALEIYTRERPDVVLLDYSMPGMDGRETALRLRQLEPARWVPIWFVTGNEDTAEIADAIAAGADAYIPKPVNVAILKAHLSNAERYTAIQRQLKAQNNELNAYFELSEEENRAARDMMKRLLPTQTEHGAVLRTWNSPAFKFSGDIVMAERSPDGSLKILLADGVGHGLTAALNVLPLGRAFQAMAQKGFGLQALVTELNHTIRRDLPSHRFVAATLISIDCIEDRIEVWNGGNPPCLMFDADGKIVKSWASRHLPLGVLPSEEIDAHPEFEPFRADAQIFVCSDGLSEAACNQGKHFGENGIKAAVEAIVPEQRFEAIKIAVVEHLAGHSATDDITYALIDCNAEVRRRSQRDLAITLPQQTLNTHSHAAAGDWELRLRVGAERLKHVEVIPILQEFMTRFDPVGAQDRSTFVVMSELFNNALEHGLLELDSGLKAEQNGQRSYSRERERRLALLTNGVILVDIARAETVDGVKLTVRVKDSGKGFDADAWHVDASALFRRNDRGISLVEQLCESVEYRENGTEIEVTRMLPVAMAIH